jgi:hypothetical protein
MSVVFNVLGNSFAGAAGSASLMSGVAAGFERTLGTLYTNLQQAKEDPTRAQALMSEITNIRNTQASMSAAAVEQGNAVTKKLNDIFGSSVRLLA